MPESRNAVATAPAVPAVALTLRLWGTRGSIPSPGPATAGYGGNTPCVEIEANGKRVILDAGSGVRPLGMQLIEDGASLDTSVFLTHFHWDHIQGFPFFDPMYRPDAQLRVIGPTQKDLDVRSLFAGQMGPIYFPLPLEAVAAQMSFEPLNEGTWAADGFTVTAMRVRHPSFAVGYRVQRGDHSVCYVPDNELRGGKYDVGPGWRERFVRFCAGTDLLVHDAMFTEQEYPSREGWGHSTFKQALELAHEAGVKRLMFFHHAPARTDEALSEIVDRLRDEAGSRGISVPIEAAAEGTEVAFG